MSRRSLLVAGAGALLLPVFGSACGRRVPVSCTPKEGVAPEHARAREAMAYADISSDKSRLCEDCAQWIPATDDDGCGGCKVLGGPVHPLGTCKSFTKAS